MLAELPRVSGLAEIRKKSKQARAHISRQVAVQTAKQQKIKTLCSVPRLHGADGHGGRASQPGEWQKGPW